MNKFDERQFKLLKLLEDRVRNQHPVGKVLDELDSLYWLREKESQSFIVEWSDGDVWSDDPVTLPILRRLLARLPQKTSLRVTGLQQCGDDGEVLPKTWRDSDLHRMLGGLV